MNPQSLVVLLTPGREDRKRKMDFKSLKLPGLGKNIFEKKSKRARRVARLNSLDLDSNTMLRNLKRASKK